MKGILEFLLPDENEYFLLAQNGWKWKEVVDELYNFIRSQEKHSDNENITWDGLREKLNELMRDEELL